MKQDIDTALALLTEAFPQTFVLEKYRPHRPLKVGIAADIPARCPAVERRVLSAALSAYARRVMYLRALVAGAARVDLDGNPAGEVTAGDAEYAAAKLAEILASRETKRAAAVDKGAAQVAKPAAARAAAAAPPAVKVVTLKKRPVLRLPAFRQQARQPSGRRIRSRDPTASVDSGGSFRSCCYAWLPVWLRRRIEREDPRPSSESPKAISRSFISASSRPATWDRMSSANCLAVRGRWSLRAWRSRIDLDWPRRAA